MRLLTLLGVATPIMAFSCAATDSTLPSDEAAIDAIRSAHVAAVNAGNAEAVLADMADDVVYLAPGMQPIRGKSALGKVIRSAYDAVDPEISMIPERVEIEGNWAVEWGLLSGTITPKAGGESLRVDGKYVYHYRRQTDGSWKVAVDIYNDNAAAAPSPTE